MSKIKLVVEIDEKRYKSICDIVEEAKRVHVPSLYAQKIIANGIPLPKGHGAIIDIKELEEFWKEHEIGHSAFNGELLYDAGRTSRHDVIWKPLLDVLLPIIEADKSESEE